MSSFCPKIPKVELEPWTKINEISCMISDKQMAMETLDQLPETVSFQQIKEELEIANGLKRGWEASKADQVKTSTEVKEMIGSWFTK